MRKQSLSRKIILAYSLLVTLAVGLLTSSLYWQFRTVQRQAMRDRLLELLRLVTPQIDSDYLALTVTADSMKEPFYKINQERLQRIQTAVPSIDRVYVLRQQPDGQLVFILDYASANRPHAPVGKALQRLTPRLKAGIDTLTQPIVEPDLGRNPDGLPVLYGYAPIINQFGRTSGVLVIALNASSVIHSELQAGALAAGVFCGVLLLTLIVIQWLSRSLVIDPILQLNQASKQIANGQWDQTLPTDRGDELGDLAASFNQMARQLCAAFATLEARVQERTAAFQESEEKFRQLAENINHIFCIEDTQGRILYTSPSYEDIWGQPVAKLYQNPTAWLEAVHPEDHDRVASELAILQKQCEGEMEYRIIRPNGEIRWVRDRAFPIRNAQGDIYRVAGIAEDITQRKHIEQEIHRSRDLFEATFQESADAIFLVDPVSLLILDCNQRAVELFEADHKHNLISIQGHTLHGSSFSEAALQELRKNTSTKAVWSQEIEYRTLNDRSFWGNFAFKRIQVAERHMNLVRVTDISERKRGEAERKTAAIALQLSEQNFRTIFNHVTTCLFIHEVDGTLLDVNDRVLERFQLARETALTLSLLDDYSAPDNPFDLAQAYWARALAGEIVCFEWKAYAISSGEVFDVDITLNRITWNGRPVILANVLDISERKRDEAARKHAELEIRRHRDLLAAIFEEATDAILLTEPGSGSIWDCNQRAVELFDADSKVELLNLQAQNLRKTPLSAEAVAEIVAFVQHSGVWRQECEYATRKGRIFWGSLAIKEIQVAEHSMILARIMDISDRKQAEFLIQRQAEADQLLAVIARTINQSLHFDGELASCLKQIQQFLQCDRVIIASFEATLRSATKLEAVSRPELSLQEQVFQNPGFSPDWFESLRRGQMIVNHDVQAETLPPWHAAFLLQMQVRADVVVPILQADQLWGLLIIHQCDQPRVWQPLEVNLLKQLGLQIGTACQKVNLYSQLENQLAQKEVLLKEVHHRVKNNLQVISAVIWLQSEAANNPIVASALADTRNRLQAMSLTHEILYQYKDLRQINFDDYIRRLANNLLAAYSTHSDQIKLILHLQPILLPLETAIPCGLLLNELVTNAIKHGFPDRRGGEICIALTRMAPPEPAIPDAANSSAEHPLYSPQAMSRYVLTVQDNGVGLPETLNLKQLKSLGLKLIYDLALQLDGKLELERNQGTLFRLAFTSPGDRQTS